MRWEFISSYLDSTCPVLSTLYLHLWLCWSSVTFKCSSSLLPTSEYSSEQSILSCLHRPLFKSNCYMDNMVFTVTGISSVLSIPLPSRCLFSFFAVLTLQPYLKGLLYFSPFWCFWLADCKEYFLFLVSYFQHLHCFTPNKNNSCNGFILHCSFTHGPCWTGLYHLNKPCIALLRG